MSVCTIKVDKDDPVIKKIQSVREFITKDSGKREDFSTGARRDTRSGKGRFDLLPVAAIKRYADLLERGAVKYGERNFEKGMPFSRYIDSAMRHLFQYMNGETDEDHLAAVMFNVGAIMHHEDAIKRGILPNELDDISTRIPHTDPQTSATNNRTDSK